MANKLPEKLTSLRKHYGYAQGETATKLHIPVAVYMNWENGNSIPNMEQLKLISGLYRVPLQDLVDNTREVALPAIENQDSIEIPFMSDNASYEQPAAQETIEVPVEEAPNEDAGDTKVMTTDQLQATKVNEIVDDDEEEPEDDDEDYDDDEEDDEDDDEEPLGLGDMFAKLFHKNKKEDEDEEEASGRHSSSGSRKKGQKDSAASKTKILIIAVAAAALLLIILLVRLLGGGGSAGGYSVSISDVNRLALGNGFSLYLKGEGQLASTGNAPSLPSDDLVQVSAGDSIAMGLKKDGTVVCTGSGSACNVDNWTQIKMIAAGTNHTVGLKSDGTVLCNGSNGACNVSDWADVDAVYAGNEITIGKKKDGTLLVSGNVSSSDRLTALKNVSSVSIGSSQIAVVNQDGTVACYAIGTDATSSTATWTNITQAAAGGSFAAGLSGGRVNLATTDPDLTEAVSTWTNVKYIAARNNTLIAAASDDTIIGAGDNTGNVYSSAGTASSSAEATESAEAAATPDDNKSTTNKLASPTGLKASAASGNVNVTWNAVTGANYYQVTIDSNPMQSIKANESHASFDASKLESGKTYTISVTAYSGNNASNPATVQLAYQGTLAAPSNVKAESGANGTSATVSWSQVSGAEWYRVFLNGQKYGNDTASTSMPISGLTAGTEYTITVEAGAGYYDGGTYKENMSSQSAAVKITPADTGSYTVAFQLSNNTSTTASLKTGTGYKVSDYVKAPSGYHLKDASQTFDVSGKDTTVQVALEQDAVSVTGFTFTLDKTSIKIGETAKATAKIDPDNASDKTVTWSSDNTGIATVSPDGTVTGVAEGSATIKGVTRDGSKTYSATITVTAADSGTDNTNNG